MVSNLRVHRRSIEQAIIEARKSRKWVPCQDIAVDAALLIIRQVERRRDAAEVRPQGQALYRLVGAMCSATGFDSGRRRLYQLVIMAYYRVIKSRRSRLCRLRALRRRCQS